MVSVPLIHLKNLSPNNDIDCILSQASLVERRTRELRAAADTLPERVEHDWRCATNESVQQEFQTAMMRARLDAN